MGLVVQVLPDYLMLKTVKGKYMKGDPIFLLPLKSATLGCLHCLETTYASLSPYLMVRMALYKPQHSINV